MTGPIINEVPIFLKDDNLALVRVGVCFIDDETREVHVHLTGCIFTPRELHSIADQSSLACERLMVEPK